MTGMDRDTFAALYRDNVSRVTGFAARRVFNPGEVADLVAATFLVAMERSDSYDPEKGDHSAWHLTDRFNVPVDPTSRAHGGHSFLATSGPVIRLRSGKVEAMMASDAASPPSTVAQ